MKNSEIQLLRKLLKQTLTHALFLPMIGVHPVDAMAQQKNKSPTVIHANVPVYPEGAQAAHIQGVVQLRLSTDGHRVVATETQLGPVMLANAAKETVNTWQFKQHAPTSFETIFRYRLLPSTCDRKCNCESAEAPSITLHLPNEVAVTAAELLLCDPASVQE